MTHHIHIQGLVQGVGFRPLVHRLGTARQLHGFVCNDTDGVHIRVNASEEITRDFLEEILSNKPAKAAIHACCVSEVEDQPFHSFTISESNRRAIPLIPVTPDYALCPSCRNEMNDPHDRRYQYPFITCTECGPRYSITHALPFDRENTVMDRFPLCEDCTREYADITDRRFYAQTISCSICGIQCSWHEPAKNMVADGNGKAIAMAVQALEAGLIIAVKGIGGYLLLTDATNATAIANLRARKERPHKPFAVLFNSVPDAEQYCLLNQQARELLQSASSPIILAPIDYAGGKKLAYGQITPLLDSMGVMIPYAPLLQLISDKAGRPLVATSANLSQSPIIYKDPDALTALLPVADGILTHNRPVLLPQDDSVVSLTSAKPIIIRRSRGLSPSFSGYIPAKGETAFALGASVKSSFALSNRGAIYISQYLGDTGNYDAQEAYRHTLQHLTAILHTEPSVLITDRHPQYFSYQLAQELASQYKIPLVTVQHHKAHFSAVLAENNLLAENDVLGVIWDGTGLGDDQQIWGGEFFLYQEKQMQRVAHLDYFTYLMGDKMAREPRVAALAIAGSNREKNHLFRQKFSGQAFSLYDRLLQQPATLRSSSIGRIIDAVASILGLCDIQTYEGQASLLLETMAYRYVKRYGYKFDGSYPFHFNNGRIQFSALIDELISDQQRHRDTGHIAAKFHFSLAMLVREIATRMGLGRIAFSGGVFQNTLLRDMLEIYLCKDFKLYFHQQLSPNDENIPFGQLVYWDQDIDNF